jgi:hypothetical protein
MRKLLAHRLVRVKVDHFFIEGCWLPQHSGNHTLGILRMYLHGAETVA